MKALRSLQHYGANRDPLAEAANTLAFVLGFNAPFYPLTVLWRAGTEGQPWVWLTALSFPFFLAIPALMRRSTVWGRAAFLALSIANTLFCTWLLGEASGTALFLLPCILLAPLLFRHEERWFVLAFLFLPAVAYFGLAGHWGTPPHLYSAAEYGNLVSVNAISVGSLVAFVGLLFGGFMQMSAASDRAGPDQPH